MLPSNNRLSSLELMPQPFAWMPISAGKVMLKEGGFVPEGGQTFEVAAFQMAKYPVTNAQYRKFIEATGYKEPLYWNEETFNSANSPVVGVSWHDALAFCHWISESTGEKITLPTDQQWQRAAQGDTGWAYPYGSEFDAARCNSSVGSASSGMSPVTKFEGKGDSPFKVVDMSGNVWEWCLTDYDSGSDETNRTDNRRVLRGGSWYYNFTALFRCDVRDKNIPDYRNYLRGFRLALSAF